MKWNVFPAEDFDRYHEVWQEMVATSSATPLLNSAFVLSLVRFFRTGDERFAVCEGPHGPLALTLVTPQGRNAWATFRPSGPVGVFLMARGVELETLMRGLLEALPGYSFALCLTQQDPELLPRPADSGHVATLDGMRPLRITIRSSFEDYWLRRGASLKRGVDRCRNDLRETGIEPRLEVLTGGHQVAQAITDYGHLECTGDKTGPSAVIHPNSTQGWFYRTVLEEFCDRERGRIYRYRFNQKVVAMALCIEGNGNLLVLKTAYDKSVERLSPALLMRRDIIRNIFDEGRTKTIEFHGALPESQGNWNDEFRTLYDVKYYRWPWLAITQPLRRSMNHGPHSVGAIQGGQVGVRHLGGKAARGVVQLAAKGFLTNVYHFRQTIREVGWLNGCLYALDRLFVAVFRGRVRLHKYYFVAQPIPEKRWLPPQRGATLEIRRVTVSDPIIKEFPRPDWAAPYRFKQGAICLAEFKAGRFIGFLWLTLGPYQEDEVRCRYIPLPEGKSAWDFDVYLEPEDRNGIAFLRLWDEANSFLRAREIRWSLSRISAFNAVSLLSHARMGAKHIGTVTFLSLGSCQFSAATVRPYFYVAKHPDSFPVFALNPEQARKNEPAQ